MVHAEKRRVSSRLATRPRSTPRCACGTCGRPRGARWQRRGTCRPLGPFVDASRPRLPTAPSPALRTCAHCPPTHTRGHTDGCANLGDALHHLHTQNDGVFLREGRESARQHACGTTPRCGWFDASCVCVCGGGGGGGGVVVGWVGGGVVLTHTWIASKAARGTTWRMMAGHAFAPPSTHPPG